MKIQYQSGWKFNNSRYVCHFHPIHYRPFILPPIATKKSNRNFIRSLLPVMYVHIGWDEAKVLLRLIPSRGENSPYKWKSINKTRDNEKRAREKEELIMYRPNFKYQRHNDVIVFFSSILPLKIESSIGKKRLPEHTAKPCILSMLISPVHSHPPTGHAPFDSTSVLQSWWVGEQREKKGIFLISCCVADQNSRI